MGSPARLRLQQRKRGVPQGRHQQTRAARSLPPSPPSLVQRKGISVAAPRSTMRLATRFGYQAKPARAAAIGAARSITGSTPAFGRATASAAPRSAGGCIFSMANPAIGEFGSLARLLYRLGPRVIPKGEVPFA